MECDRILDESVKVRSRFYFLDDLVEKMILSKYLLLNHKPHLNNGNFKA